MSSECHINAEVVLDTNIDTDRGISRIGFEIGVDNEDIIAFLKMGLPLGRGETLSVQGEIDRIRLVGCLQWDQSVLALKEKYQSQIDAIYAEEDRLQEEELVDRLIDEFYEEYDRLGED